MGRCVYCGNLNKNKKKATLHRFPLDVPIREKWLKLLGLEGLNVGNNTLLCSSHFTPDCFTVFHCNQKRLKLGSMSTIFEKVSTSAGVSEKENCEPQRNILMETNSAASKIEQVPETSITVEYSESLTTSEGIFTQGVCSTPKRTCASYNKFQCVTLHDTVFHDHNYDDSPQTTKRKLNVARMKLDETRKANKTLKQTVRRLKTKVNSLRDVVKALKNEKLLPENAFYCLSPHEDISLELFNRIVENRKNGGKLTREKYPAGLRAFALTVHFYSPKAYDYIRKTFDLALPHPDVLRTWYNSVDAEPGFTEESFRTLKEMSSQLREKGKKLLCSVLIDEMTIKKGCQRGRDGVMRGHVDLGVGTSNGDDLLEATSAIVIMVVMLDTHGKLPIGYFLINSLNAEAKANLSRESFIRLQKANVTVCSLTLDGPTDHFAALEELGARMHVEKQRKTFDDLYDIFKVNFPHPTHGEPDINVILDACHMLKNIRNCLGEYKVLIDRDGNRIEWRYLEQLALLQESEGLRLGNRLHFRHIQFRKMIMKVFLAAQTLRFSVADSLEFCCDILQLPEFQGCKATARFLRCVDTIFDFLNVRNPWGKHTKSPLRRDNENVWRPKLVAEIAYLAKLTEENGKPIFRSRRKAGFVGFFTAVISIFNIFDSHVKPLTSQMKYLLTYKTSQDHLELFFCAIRARGGWCPNPTVSQFISAYKRLLIRHDISINTGNTRAIDNTRIFHVSSGEYKKTVQGLIVTI